MLLSIKHSKWIVIEILLEKSFSNFSYSYLTLTLFDSVTFGIVYIIMKIQWL